MSEAKEYSVSESDVTIVEGSAQDVESLSTPAVRNGKDKTSAKPKDDGTEVFFIYDQDKDGKQKIVKLEDLQKDYAQAIFGVNRYQRDILMELLTVFSHHENPKGALEAFWPGVKAKYLDLEKVKERGQEGLMSPDSRKDNAERRTLARTTIKVYESMATRVLSAAITEFEKTGTWEKTLTEMKRQKNFNAFVKSLPTVSGRGRPALTAQGGRTDGPQPASAVQRLETKARKEGFKLVPISSAEHMAEGKDRLRDSLKTQTAQDVVSKTGSNKSALSAIIDFIQSCKDVMVLEQITQVVAISWRDNFEYQTQAWNKLHPERLQKIHPLGARILEALTDYDNMLESIEPKDAEVIEESDEQVHREPTNGQRKSA
jgi:hypothetical protein